MTETAEVATLVEATLVEILDSLRGSNVLDERGLDVAVLDGMTYDEYEALGRYLGAMTSALRFAIGDWVNWGEAAFPDRYSQAMNATGLSFSTIRSYASVAAAVARVRRRTPEVSWSHHEAVATLSAREQRRWLDRISREGWTVEETRDARRAADEEEGDGGEVSPTERVTLSDAARSVWLNSSRHGEVFHVPVEAMLRLARAMGESV